MADTFLSQQEVHLQTVTEVLQSIKASEMTPMLQRIFQSEGGSEALDVLMKYLYVRSPSVQNVFVSDYADSIATRAWLPQVPAKGSVGTLPLLLKAQAFHKWVADQELETRAVVQP